MTPEDKLKIKSEIESKIASTKKSIESLREQSKPVAPDPAIGRLTRMDAIQQKNMNEANLRSAEETLLNLEEALSKVDELGFGECVRCKKPIPIERMLAIPESTECVNCVGRLF